MMTCYLVSAQKIVQSFLFRRMKYVVGHYDKLDSCSVLFFRIESDGTIPPERPQKKTQLARASTITGTIVDFWLL